MPCTHSRKQPATSHPPHKLWPLLLASPLLALIAFYRYVISPLTPASCRYLPTCSDYASQALKQHGAIKGSWLALKRLLRCHPLGGSGVDEVPPKS